MKKNDIPFYITSLLFLFFSCKKEVSFNLPSVTPKIVLNCTFTQDSAWQVRLYESAAAGGGSIYKEIKNAQIEVYENDKLLTTLGQFVEKIDFARQKTSYYTESLGILHAPKCGHLYTIKVQATDFEAVSASSFLPLTPVIENFETSDIKAMVDKSNFLSPSIKLEGTLHYTLIKNTNNKINYYGAALVHEATVKPIAGHYVSINYVAKEDTSYLKYIDYGFDKVPYDFPGGAYINKIAAYPDTLLKGSTPIVSRPFFSLAQRISIPKEMYFEVYQFDPAYYNYGTSAVEQLQSANDPFSEAKPVYGNIQGGYGIFAGYATKRFIIKL
ncbi:MAG: hypothetical protein RLZZ292_3553 [Bacteroidota bacterium]|jgi:hypothetical protein